MTTIHEALALAARLTRDAACDDIHVNHVFVAARGDSVYIDIYAEDMRLAPALAVTLGLTDRHVNEGNEHFRGRVAGVDVSTFGPLPLAVVVDTDTAEVLTEPMPREEAELVARHGGTRRVHIEAVAR